MSYLFKIFFLLLIFTHLYANNQLQSNYSLKHNYISLSDIVKNTKQDKKLFFIEEGHHSKRIQAKKVLKILKKLGYKDYTSQHSYIQFTQKSPIDTQKIAQKIREAFLNTYKDIQIQKITITPRTYMTKLPAQYEIKLERNSVLRSHGYLKIKTPQRKEIFFFYTIEAKINLFIARNEIKRGEELSHQNTQHKSRILDRFNALPLQEVPQSKYQTKHRIQKGTILTTRDVTGLYLIKRGDRVSLTILDANIQISFLAKADRNGRYGDTITFTNNNGKKIRAVVIGKDRAKVQ